MKEMPLPAIAAASPLQTISREHAYYRALNSSTRREILELVGLTAQQPSSLAMVLELSPSTISHHLRVLEGAHLIRIQRRGRARIVRLSDEWVTKRL